MQIETVNVVEIFNDKVQQVISFTEEQEAFNLFKKLVLEHNDPDNDPPQDVMGFEEELDNMVKRGEYDDDNGYSIQLVYSKLSPKTA